MNTSSIFLLNSGGNNFEDVPKDIYVDTCFWQEAYGKNTTYGASCQQFLRECALNDTTLYRSTLVTEEIAHVISKATIKDYATQSKIKIPRFPNGGVDNKLLTNNVLKENPDIVLTISNEINRINGIIDSITEPLPYEHNENFQKNVERLSLEYKYRVDTADVKHILIPHMYGINNTLTVDIDYVYAQNLNIFAVPTSKYKREAKYKIYPVLDFDANKF